MVLLNTTSFSGVASQVIPTIFSATYENYKIVLTLTAASADAGQDFKLRSGATDSSASYYYGIQGLTDANGANNMTNQNISSGFRYGTSDAGFGDFTAAEFNLYKPFLAVRTIYSVIGHALNTSGVRFGFSGGGFHDAATSYDSINLVPSAGTISGKVSVYGFNS